jgi:bifunctional non-homologous end joining protein LigD
MLWRYTAPFRRPPGFIEPCLPTAADTVPSGPQWVHEIKHDGFRFICRLEGGRVRVFSRRGNEYTERVPRIVDTLVRLPASSVTLDGEGVACDPTGVSNFELMRAALGRPAKREVFLYAFDLLEFNGRDMRREPWSDQGQSGHSDIQRPFMPIVIPDKFLASAMQPEAFHAGPNHANNP